MTTQLTHNNPPMLKMNKWWQEAKCKGQEVKTFDLKGQPNKHATARELCAGCPVKPQCANDALQHGDTGLVRGGVWVPSETTVVMRHEREAVNNALYEVVMGGM